MGKVTVLAATAVINTGKHDFSFLFYFPDPALVFDDPWGGLERRGDRWHIALYASTGLRFDSGATVGQEMQEIRMLNDATRDGNITLLMAQSLLPSFERIAQLAGIETVIHRYDGQLSTSRISGV